MGLVFAAIAPHGGECLPEFAGENPARAARTREAMARMGDRLAELQPDVVVVATPHGLATPGAMAVPIAERAWGYLDGNGQRVEAEFRIDGPLAWTLAALGARAGVPVAPAFFPQGFPAPLDWGALIPLYYMGRGYRPRPQVVLVTPSPDVPLSLHVKLGEALAEAAERSGKRVAYIASADQGHCHHPDGPYGYDEKSAEYDRLFCAAVEEEDLGRLLRVPEDLIERGKPDSLWQALILHGALQRRPMRGRLLSYEVPTYFGMACAMYEPK